MQLIRKSWRLNCHGQSYSKKTPLSYYPKFPSNKAVGGAVMESVVGP